MYIVNDGCINDKSFGIPQNREWAIIIGSLSRSINLPEGEGQEIVTVREAISDLSYLNSGEGVLVDNYINDSQLEYQKLMRREKVYNYIVTNHTSFTLEKIKMIPPEGGDKSSMLKELHGKQKISITWSRLKWDDKFDYVGWIKDYVALLNKSGSVIIFCSYLYISYIIDELKNNDIEIKDVIFWEKTNLMPRNVNRRYVQDMGFAIWVVKRGSKWVFNKPSDVSYLRSLFESSLVSGNEKVGHPTQKGLSIMEAIIKIHTNPGDLVIIPFMGSGTTGITSLKNERKFIGVENNIRYYKWL